MVLGSFLFFTPFTRAQIEIGGEESKPEKENHRKAERTVKATQTDSGEESFTEAYMMVNWSNTTRILRQDDGILQVPLGEREFETPLNTWSYGVGVQTQLNDHLMWKGGMTLLSNGERYRLEEEDTLLAYQTKYTYIGMPLKLLFTTGTGFKFMIGGGLTPQLFVQYRQDREWRTTTGATGTETLKFKNGYESFVLGAALNIGFQYRLNDQWSFLFLPEYRIQLTNAYVKNDPYEYFGRALGVDVGLTMKL